MCLHITCSKLWVRQVLRGLNIYVGRKLYLYHICNLMHHVWCRTISIKKWSRHQKHPQGRWSHTAPWGMNTRKGKAELKHKRKFLIGSKQKLLLPEGWMWSSSNKLPWFQFLRASISIPSSMSFELTVNYIRPYILQTLCWWRAALNPFIPQVETIQPQHDISGPHIKGVLKRPSL